MNGFSLRSPLWIGVLLVMLVTLGMGGGYLYLKGVAARNAVELAMDWNPDHTCAIKTYAPSLGERSGLSRLFHLVTSPTFFRVYDQQGRLLKSSEWLLWQREAGELEAPQWMGNGRVLYPTTQGYAAWTIPECSMK